MWNSFTYTEIRASAEVKSLHIDWNTCNRYEPHASMSCFIKAQMATNESGLCSNGGGRRARSGIVLSSSKVQEHLRIKQSLVPMQEHMQSSKTDSSKPETIHLGFHEPVHLNQRI